MRHTRFLPLLLTALLILAAGACKKNAENHVSVKLIALAEKINAAPDTVLSNGMTLTGCSIDAKDSLFTYNLKVPDTRFNALTADSLKKVFASELKADGKKNLLKILRDNSLGLRYVCTLPDTTLSVVFTPTEIAGYKSDKQ